MSTDASGPDTRPLTNQIYEELRGRTSRAEAITSAELSEKLDIGDCEGNPETRELIREVMTTRDLPIVAGPKGYHVATSKAEVESYCETLDARIQGIQQRKYEAIAAWNRGVRSE
jgi:hypothetical protein